MTNFTDPDDEYLDNGVTPYRLASFVCACLLIITAVFGCIGNMLSYWVFAKSSVASSINILLAAQAVVDIVLLVVATPLFATMGFYMYNPGYKTGVFINILVAVIYPVAMMAQTATVWATVVITCERYLAVCRPFKAMILCTPRNAKSCLIVVVSTAVLYNFCRFFEYKLTTDYDLIPYLRGNSAYMKIYYHWLYFTTIFFTPLVVLTLLNGFIIRKIYYTQRQTRLTVNRKQHKEYQTSVMMIVITGTFLICNILAFVLKLFENVCFHDKNATFCDEPYFNFLIDLNNLLVESNSCVPFLVYVTFSRCFRTRLIRMFTTRDTICWTLLKPFKCLENKFKPQTYSECHHRVLYSNHSNVSRLLSAEVSI